MLNRRTLRIKAMQSLFAYDQCRESNKNLAKELIDDAFKPDLNSMQPQDRVQLKADCKIAKQLFEKNHDLQQLLLEDAKTPEIRTAVIDALNYYHKQNKKDLEYLRHNMLSAAENIPSLYMKVLLLLAEFAEMVYEENEKRLKGSRIQSAAEPISLNLHQNKIVHFINNSRSLKAEMVRRNISWADDRDLVKSWYKDYVKTDEAFLTYARLDAPTFEQDQEIAIHLVKKIIFKVDAIMDYFQSMDINWAENKSITKSLAANIIKWYAPDIDPDDFELPEISQNWEEDKQFFEDIFDETVKNRLINKALISPKTKNWDFDRIASTDRIILDMALTEMQFFHSIPVKVTINEYIELSKNYSTPKSKQFINGLLDVLSAELDKAGKIRKSGRGLLDNK